MNFFKVIDNYFPTGSNRVFGEVVSVTVRIVRQEVKGSVITNHSLGLVSMKRKAVYKNASVNAFLLHRVLCKELSSLIARDGFRFTSRTERAIKRKLSDAVWNAYVANNVGDHQYSMWTIVAPCQTNAKLDKQGNLPGTEGKPVLFLNALDTYVTDLFQRMTVNWSYGENTAPKIEALHEHEASNPSEVTWESAPFQFLDINQ